MRFSAPWSSCLSSPVMQGRCRLADFCVRDSGVYSSSTNPASSKSCLASVDADERNLLSRHLDHRRVGVMFQTPCESDSTPSPSHRFSQQLAVDRSMLRCLTVEPGPKAAGGHLPSNPTPSEPGRPTRSYTEIRKEPFRLSNERGWLLVIPPEPFGGTRTRERSCELLVFQAQPWVSWGGSRAHGVGTGHVGGRVGAGGGCRTPQPANHWRH